MKGVSGRTDEEKGPLLCPSFPWGKFLGYPSLLTSNLTSADSRRELVPTSRKELFLIKSPGTLQRPRLDLKNLTTNFFSKGESDLQKSSLLLASHI